MSCLKLLLVLPVLEAVWERVGVGVVDEGVVAVTPGELLGPGQHTNVCHVSRVSRVTIVTCDVSRVTDLMRR